MSAISVRNFKVRRSCKILVISKIINHFSRGVTAKQTILRLYRIEGLIYPFIVTKILQLRRNLTSQSGGSCKYPNISKYP
jgi:hypothetical protein